MVPGQIVWYGYWMVNIGIDGIDMNIRNIRAMLCNAVQCPQATLLWSTSASQLVYQMLTYADNWVSLAVQTSDFKQSYINVSSCFLPCRAARPNKTWGFILSSCCMRPQQSEVQIKRDGQKIGRWCKIVRCKIICKLLIASDSLIITALVCTWDSDEQCVMVWGYGNGGVVSQPRTVGTSPPRGYTFDLTCVEQCLGPSLVQVWDHHITSFIYHHASSFVLTRFDCLGAGLPSWCLSFSCPPW